MEHEGIKYDVSKITSCKGNIKSHNEMITFNQTYRNAVKPVIINIMTKLLDKNRVEGDDIIKIEEMDKTIQHSLLSCVYKSTIREHHNVHNIEGEVSSSISKYTCPISETKEDIKLELPEYLNKILDGTSDEYRYLNEKKVPYAYRPNAGYIIIPDTMYYPITNNDRGNLISKIIYPIYDDDGVSVLVNGLTDVKRTKDSSYNPSYNIKKLKDKLQTLFKIRYNFYITDKYKNVRSIRDLNETICNNIINNIINFYSIVLLLPIKENQFLRDMIYCNVKEQNIGFLLITFGLFPINTGHLYKSFIEYQEEISIFDILNILKSGQSVVNYKSFLNTDSENLDKHCLDNNLYKMFKYCSIEKDDTSNEPATKQNKLTDGGGNSKLEDFEIINNYSQNDNQSNCSTKVLIKTASGDYFNITMINETYKSLDHNKNNVESVFYKHFIRILHTYINNPKNIAFKNDESSSSYIFKLPSITRIIIKKEYNYKPNVGYLISESSHDYNNKTLKQIKESTVSNSVVMILLIYSILRKHLNINNDTINVVDLVDSLDKYEGVVKSILENIKILINGSRNVFRRLNLNAYIATNFIVILGDAKNIMWFCFKDLYLKDSYDISTKFKNIVDKFIEEISYIDPSIQNDKKVDDQIIQNENIKKIIDENTNFYEYYAKEKIGFNFLYNIRHAYSSSEEIDSVIIGFMKSLNLCGELGRHSYDNYFIYAHYPNHLYFNILHFHIIGYGNKFNKSIYISKRHINVNEYIVLWNKWKYYDMINMNMFGRTTLKFDLIEFEKYARHFLMNRKHIDNLNKLHIKQII